MKSYGDEYFNNPNKRVVDDAIYMFIETLNSVEGDDVSIDDIPCKAYITNAISPNSETKEERTISVLVEQPIKTGDYIKGYDEGIYLVTTDIDNHISHKEAKIRKCNHLLKWMYKGELYECLSIVTNNTKYTEGTKSQVSGIIEQSAMFNVQVPNIEKTKMLGLDQRLIINDMAWKVTLPDRTLEGLLILTLGKSSINTETDNLELGVADYYTVKHDYKFDIPSNFNVTKDDSIKLVYSIQDNLKDIDYNLVDVEYSGNLIQVIKDDKDITIIGKELGTGNIKLKVNLTNETKEFNINFNVFQTIVKEVKYNVTTSNKYTYRPKEGASLVATKYINGTIDTSLIIDYSLDSVGTNLLSKGNISIVKKSNTELQIRNVNISTPMSFTLTITDKSNGTVILTQVIALKGA